MQASGLFISFEGGDGAGKTTQIARCADYIRQKGREVLITREPGGTKGAEILRDLIKDDALEWGAETETLLIYTARLDHVEKIIKPAMAKGKIVLCDRFHDSTLAYQGGGRGVDAEWIMKLHLHLLGDFMPDLTFLLSMPPADSMRRVTKRAVTVTEKTAEKNDVFEGLGADFHARVHKYFAHLAELTPHRIININANQDMAKVTANITQHLAPLLVA